MHIQFEVSTKTVVSRPNRNNPNARWYIAEQPAIMFKEDSKYPDKFDLTLAVSDSEQEANNSQPFAVGSYVITDDSFGLDRNGNPQVDFSKLTPMAQAEKLKAAS